MFEGLKPRHQYPLHGVHPYAPYVGWLWFSAASAGDNTAHGWPRDCASGALVSFFVVICRQCWPLISAVER